MSYHSERPKSLAELLGLSGLIHVWGPPGCGKTLFAALMAADASRLGHVVWLIADGKRPASSELRRVIVARGGRTGSFTVVNVVGHVHVLREVLNLHRRIRDDTRMIVVDPITRVLDMGRTDDLMWGRELFEEAMPSLAALCATCRRHVLLTSEVRDTPSGIRPVFHDSILRWVSHDLMLSRRPGLGLSDVYEMREGEARHLAVFSRDGVLEVAT